MEQALYRKYRPQTFADVLGQEHVIDILRNAVESGSISHAYLFAGSRGTGKTSVARILARELGTAESDTYEIDAASNRGIDEVRELREAVHTLPYESKYKIYIVDEVHMLTTPAFNALLKTLEEPPAHVIFILATTELEKLPDTVISRCEIHRFKKPTLEVLKNHVRAIAEKEGYGMDDASDDLISILGDGSYRDTLGVLQKVMGASKGKKILKEEVEKITGAPRSALVNDYLQALADGQVELGMKAVGRAVEANTDIKTFAKLILHKCRAVILLRNAPSMESGLQEEFSAEDFSFIKELSSGRSINSQVLETLLEAYSKIQKSFLPHLPLELALLDVAEKAGEKEA